MKRYLLLTLAVSLSLMGGEIEQVERISKEIETLRSDYESCRAQLEQGKRSEPKQEFRALRNDELMRSENERLGQRLLQCENESRRLDQALEDASGTINTLKENARLADQKSKNITDEMRTQIEAVRLEAKHERAALQKALDKALEQVKTIQDELEKERRKKVKSVEKIKRIEKIKTVEKVVPQLCEDPNPFPKLLKKETLQ